MVSILVELQYTWIHLSSRCDTHLEQWNSVKSNSTLLVKKFLLCTLYLVHTVLIKGEEQKKKTCLFFPPIIPQRINFSQHIEATAMVEFGRRASWQDEKVLIVWHQIRFFDCLFGRRVVWKDETTATKREREICTVKQNTLRKKNAYLGWYIVFVFCF